MTKESLEQQLADTRKKLRNTSSPSKKAILQALIKALLAALGGIFPVPVQTKSKPRSKAKSSGPDLIQQSKRK